MAGGGKLRDTHSIVFSVNSHPPGQDREGCGQPHNTFRDEAITRVNPDMRARIGRLLRRLIHISVRKLGEEAVIPSYYGHTERYKGRYPTSKLLRQLRLRYGY